jgi:hypothetical protein
MSHFTRAFIRSLGMTPYAPAEHAQRLMLITQCPLSEIALKCGFSGASSTFRDVSADNWDKQQTNGAVSIVTTPTTAQSEERASCVEPHSLGLVLNFL